MRSCWACGSCSAERGIRQRYEHFFPAARQTTTHFAISFMRQKGSSVTDEGPGRTPFGFIVYSYQVKNKNFAKQPLQGSNRKRSAPNASAFYYFKKSTIFEKSSFASLKMAVYLFLTNLSAFVLLPLAALNPRHLFLFCPCRDSSAAFAPQASGYSLPHCRSRCRNGTFIVPLRSANANLTLCIYREYS